MSFSHIIGKKGTRKFPTTTCPQAATSRSDRTRGTISDERVLWIGYLFLWHISSWVEGEAWKTVDKTHHSQVPSSICCSCCASSNLITTVVLLHTTFEFSGKLMLVPAHTNLMPMILAELYENYFVLKFLVNFFFQSTGLIFSLEVLAEYL